MLRATLRSLLARKIRLVLSALAVIVGVSFVTGTLVLTDTLNRTFDSLFSNITKNVSVAVRSVNNVDSTSDANRRPLPAALVTDLAKVNGVRAAVGTVSGQAVLIDPSTGKAVKTGGAPGLGTNWTGGAATSATEIAQGRAPGAHEVVVDKGTADRIHLTVGERVSVQAKGQAEQFTLVGTFRTGGQDSLGGAVVTAFSTPDAQRVLLAKDQFSAIHLAAAAGVSQQDLVTRVEKVLPRGDEAITGAQLADENKGTVQDALGFLSTALLIFAGISVFVGAFIIFNTFTMLVAQRVRELALMRALGASRRQVQTSVQVEAALVGFVGATLGLAFGVGLAQLLHAAMGAFGVVLPAGGMAFLPHTVIIAYAVGILVTSAAAVVPAYKAATVPPIAALRDTYTMAARSLRIRAIVGVLVAVVGAAAVVAGLAGSGGTTLVGLGAGMIFLGVTALSPVLATPVTRVLGSPLPRLFGATGRLGLQNAMRNPRRTASTASALMIGLALVSAFAIFGQSIKVSVRDTVAGSLGADYYLTTDSPGQGFSGGLARSLAKQPGIQSVTGLRGGPVTVEGKTTPLLAGDPAAVTDLFALKKVDGDLALTTGSIAMDADTAAGIGLKVGAPVRVTYPDGPSTLRLIGTFEKNQLIGKYLVSTSEWSRHSATDLDTLVMANRKPGADPAAVRAAIEATAKPYPNVTVDDQTEFVASQSKQVDQILGIVYVLLALAVIIALFGIVNTLALSVIERTREIGLLRAVGLSRTQMWLVVVLESIVIAVFGAALGVAVGSFLGWALVSALSSQGITSFAYPIGTIFAVLVVGAVLGIAAAVFPALRAARMNVLRAIATA
jgi:putative ABC transport system permease protein